VANTPSCSGPNPLKTNDTVCIPCSRACGTFSSPVRVFTDAYPSYGDCSNVVLDLPEGGMCSTSC
jgi:hypothetical protein